VQLLDHGNSSDQRVWRRRERRACAPVPPDLGVVALGRGEDAWEQAVLWCEELDPDEPAVVVEVEDDAVVCVLGAGWRDRLRGDGADVGLCRRAKLPGSPEIG
jgi:hypothetical protein